MLQISPWPQAGTLSELAHLPDFSVPAHLPPSLAGFSWNPFLVTTHTHMPISGLALQDLLGVGRWELGERQEKANDAKDKPSSLGLG